MSPGVLLVISPRIQKLSANPGCDFARMRVLRRSVTSDACKYDSSGNSPPCQLLGSASCQLVFPRNSPWTLAFRVRHAQLLAVREVNHPSAQATPIRPKTAQ